MAEGVARGAGRTAGYAGRRAGYGVARGVVRSALRPHPQQGQAGPASPPKDQVTRADREMPPPLSEIARFIARFIVAPQTYIDAMVLIAAQTHCLDELVTTLRALFTAEVPQAGKTEAMLLLASLCENPMDADGSSYGSNNALVSGLLANAMAGITHAPTLYYDDIGKIFGDGGTRGRSNALYKILVKGYKKRATSSTSIDRARQEYSTYSTFLMTGLKTAIPNDVYTRCIVFRMEPGTPRDYFDVRTAEPMAEKYASLLHRWVRAHAEEIGAFRARGLHPKLNRRLLEIWEGMFAVAAAAGQEWLNRCMAAFTELALDDGEIPLSPEQSVIRDCAEVIIRAKLPMHQGDPVIPTSLLVEELKRLGEEMYDGRTDHSLGILIADALAGCGVRPGLRRVTGAKDPVRCYLADAVTSAWEAIRPDEEGFDVEVPEDGDPFAGYDESNDPETEIVTEKPQVRARS